MCAQWKDQILKIADGVWSTVYLWFSQNHTLYHLPCTNKYSSKFIIHST